MYVLGVNCWLHDTAAALLRDGAVVAALEEERWYRDDKHTSVFPARSIRWCLQAAQDAELAIDHVAINLSPLRCFGDARGRLDVLFSKGGLRDRRNRRAYRHLRRFGERTAREIRHVLAAAGLGRRFTFHEVPHHDAHAASAFNLSGFEEAAILTVDGLGEWATTTSSMGRGTRIERLATIGLPHSLGTFYASFTDYLGFRRNNDEYKVMGLASFGDPARFRGVFRELIRTTEDGGVDIDTRPFERSAGVLFPGQGLERLFEGPSRVPESELGDRHHDIAAALQEATEEVGVHLARHLQRMTGSTNLCLAGGVALNCVMNTRILAETDFEALYVQPAAYDAGGSLGAASWATHQILGLPREAVMDRTSYGPAYGDHEIEALLRDGMLRFRRSDDIAQDTAQLLADGKIVGWFQGGAEFGPRALGHRSILADPTRDDMQDHVNRRVKHREDFRPFAPSVIHEAYRSYFDTEVDDPFMTKVVPVRADQRAKLPAITHIDGTARVHTVKRETNPLYHRMIEEFGRLRGIPVVLNTSFNVRGEPMVLTPQDALRCFFGTGIDHLALGSFIVDK